MVADKRRVYVPFLDGRLVALDITSGQEQWVSGGDYGLLRWAPAVFGNRLFAGGSKALTSFRQ